MSRAYERVNFRGRTLNRRTVAMIQQAESVILDFQLHIMQGSYNGGGGAVSASAGTHDGGGAVDFAWPGGSKAKADKVVKALRRVGFAAWRRDNLPGVWGPHIHAIAIGDKSMSRGAGKQVQDYYAGLNGLAGHARDSTWRPNPIPVFSYPLKKVDLSNVHAIAKSKRVEPVGRPGIKIIQNALNAKTGTHLKPDGVYGPQTKAAFARYERQVGGDGDGIPGIFALEQLGLARFTVVK